MRKVLIHSLFIFMITILIYNAYHYLPIFPFTTIYKVEENALEYMKIIFTSHMLFLVFCLLFNKDKAKINIFIRLVSSIINMVIFLIIYLLISNQIVLVILFFLTIILSNYLSIKITLKPNKKLRVASYISIFVIYLVFGLITIF